VSSPNTLAKAIFVYADASVFGGDTNHGVKISEYKSVKTCATESISVISVPFLLTKKTSKPEGEEVHKLFSSKAIQQIMVRNLVLYILVTQ
jgi:hypothetical protein